MWHRSSAEVLPTNAKAEGRHKSDFSVSDKFLES